MTMLSAAALCLADALFLWMFLGVAPLEQLADRGAIAAQRDDVYRFASAWRHGMAGNAPLYMPGFFAIAATAWFGVARQSKTRLAIELTLILFASLGLAWLAWPTGAAIVMSDFGRESGIQVPSAPPVPSFGAILTGCYTALTWTAFVMACRIALRNRSLRPFVPVAALTAILAVARPWTVGDFTHHWTTRAASGDVVATASVIACIVLGAMLALSEMNADVSRTRRSETNSNESRAR